MDKSPVMLITGTRKGIGAQLAKHYTGKGYQVIGCSRKKVDFELNNYHHFCLDVTNETEVKKAYLEIKRILALKGETFTFLEEDLEEPIINRPNSKSTIAELEEFYDGTIEAEWDW